MTKEEAKFINQEIARICDSFEFCSNGCPLKSTHNLQDYTRCRWVFEATDAHLGAEIKSLYKYDDGIRALERLSEFLIGTKWEIPTKFDIGNQNDFIGLF